MPYEINPKYIYVNDLVENIEDYFQGSTRILYDQRNEIRVVSFEGQDFVVKAFKIPNLINRIAYRYFRASKAKRSYLYSLKIGGELTPEPVAYIENNKNLLLSKSYYISLYYNYDHTIREVLTCKTLDERESILKAFADFTYQLHEEEILHHDYSHGNILIKRESVGNTTNYEFKIVDINRMEFRPLSLEMRLANFARINADDEDMQTIITSYAKCMKLDSYKLFEQAQFYRDDFYQKRAFRNRLRGKLIRKT